MGMIFCVSQICATIAFSAIAADENRPSATDARSALQSRMEQQSNGRIKLTDFRTTADKTGLMEINGEKIYPVVFAVRVEVVGPCKWASRQDGKPLTFNTYTFDDPNAPTGSTTDDIIEVSQPGDKFMLRGVGLFTMTDQGWKLVGFGDSSRPKRASDELSDECVNRLKQIGLAFRIWEGDNNDRFPFNVSTNAGGTMELCAPGGEGFDKNGFMHLRVMSNELSTPKLLVCPADSSKHPVASFSVLQPENVSYLIRSGTNIDDYHPDEIIARCPIHGHILHSDGRVERGDKK